MAWLMRLSNAVDEQLPDWFLSAWRHTDVAPIRWGLSRLQAAAGFERQGDISIGTSGESKSRGLMLGLTVTVSIVASKRVTGK